MKTMGLCSVILLVLPIAAAQGSSIFHQDKSTPPVWNLDRDAAAKWGQQRWHSKRFEKKNDGVMAAMDDLEPGCGTMRTYQVKREARDSDVTRPSGYTTCVPMAKFRIEELRPKPEPVETKPAPSE